jgi:hypothetical protein
MSLLDPFGSNFAAVPYRFPVPQQQQQQFRPQGFYTPTQRMSPYNQQIESLLGFSPEQPDYMGGDSVMSAPMSYGELAQAYQNSPMAQAIAANPGMLGVVGTALGLVSPALAPVGAMLGQIGRGMTIAKALDPMAAQAMKGTDALAGFSPPGSIQAMVDQGLLSIPAPDPTPYSETMDAFALGVADAMGTTGIEGFGAAADAVGGAGVGADAGVSSEGHGGPY